MSLVGPKGDIDVGASNLLVNTRFAAQAGRPAVMDSFILFALDCADPKLASIGLFSVRPVFIGWIALLATDATGSSGRTNIFNTLGFGNISASGVGLCDIPDPDETFERVRSLVDTQRV
jgi:hypothetical protein